MIINNNILALSTNNKMTDNLKNVSDSVNKLASGLRINTAADDAAGLAISEKMRGQIRGMNQAARNAQDAISMVQTFDGALNETSAILQRMRELAVQAANDTYVTNDRKKIRDEVKALSDEISRIASQTEFNTQRLIGSANAATVTPNLTTKEYANTNTAGDAISSDRFLQIHVGANSGQVIELNFREMNASSLGVTVTMGTTTGDLVLTTQGGAELAIGLINCAINNVANERAKYGAYVNRLEYTINNLTTSSENTVAAESRIRDVDMAKEMMSFTKNNILSQASQAMLAQANQLPQGVLQLLR